MNRLGEDIGKPYVISPIGAKRGKNVQQL